MANNDKNQKDSSDDRFNTEFWREQKRKTLIESTGASVRLSGSKVTNDEVAAIIGSERNKKLYQCPECGFHYADDSTSLITGKEWAEKCEAWCREHKSCNIEITAHAEENKSKEQLNCIVIHGCPSDAEKAMDPERRTYDKHWIPWIKKNLTALGVKTEVPLMPNPWAPDYDAFKREFEKLEVSEDTILIGHSCGCAFLVRWLGESKQKIKKLILVAPWKIADEEDQFRPAFYNYPIDETIKDRVDDIVMFTADDEEDAGKESLQIFHKALGGRIIELKGRGHYTLGDMGTEEFPELLENIVSFNNRKALIVPINSNGKIFIQDRRGHKKPDWGYFGGEIETDETPLQAVIRESDEELQVSIQSEELQYLGISVTDWNGYKIIRYMFLYPTDRAEFSVLEGKGGHWLTFEEVREKLDDKDRFDEIASRIKKFQS